MTKRKLEYVWLDGDEPQNLRSKTKIVNETDLIFSSEPENYPVWSFDGSSTKQMKSGKGKNTDCLLNPVYIVNDPFKTNSKLVFCEVLNPDGTPHSTNKRRALKKTLSNHNLIENRRKINLPWFGWEQEYTLTHKHDNIFEQGEGMPLGFTNSKKPRPQGDYYCGIGADSVIGRKIVEDHMEKCIETGLDIAGINAEVLIGQWEYQIGPVTALNGADQLWISRYILHRVAEEHNVKISFHPKLINGDWNGSGCHVNFSNKEMRDENGLELIEKSILKLKDKHKEHINVYGLDNEKRMTGKHETSNIHEFTYGYSTRDTSVRIPAQSIIDKKGYFEDRRPASNCDPYLVANRMIKTIYE